MTIVLDASVAIKWVLLESPAHLIREARELLERQARGEVEFIAPDFFWAEVGSVLTRAVRQKRWQAQDAVSALEEISKIGIKTEAVADLMTEAVRIAILHHQSVYDTFYVAMAMDRGIEMITADRRLYNALGAHYPVRWLGGWISRI